MNNQRPSEGDHHPTDPLSEKGRIERLVLKARAAQLGPLWDFPLRDGTKVMERMQTLADLLSEVTEELDSLSEINERCHACGCYLNEDEEGGG